MENYSESSHAYFLFIYFFNCGSEYPGSNLCQYITQTSEYIIEFFEPTHKSCEIQIIPSVTLFFTRKKKKKYIKQKLAKKKSLT